MLGICRCDLYVNTQSREASVSGPNRPKSAGDFPSAGPLGYTHIRVATLGAHALLLCV